MSKQTSGSKDLIQDSSERESYHIDEINSLRSSPKERDALVEGEFSSRTSNVLFCHQIRFFDQLTRLSRHELLRMRNCGKKTVDEIETALAARGMSLLKEDPSPVKSLGNKRVALLNRVGSLNKELDGLKRYITKISNEISDIILNLTHDAKLK